MAEKIFPPGREAGEICFGMDRETDEHSLAAFLRRFASEPLLATLIPRLKAVEIEATVDLLSALLRHHLSEKEYHRLFLQDGKA